MVGKMVAGLMFPFLWVLGQVLGCPCCGPRWYRDVTVFFYRLLDEEVPPELQL